MEELILLCPKCKSNHIYSIEVERSFSMGMTNPFAEKKVMKKKFTRIFICPTQKEQFQASIVYNEDTNMKIKDVKVLGLKNESE